MLDEATKVKIFSDVDEIVSEEEDHVSIEHSSPSDEEIERKGELPNIMTSKDQKISWQNKPFPNTGRLRINNVLNLILGLTCFSTARIQD